MKLIYYICILFTVTLSANPLMKQANLLYQQEKYDQAIVVYEKLIANNQQSLSLYYNLANAHYKLNHVAPSIYYYEKALILAPNDPEVLNNLEFAKAMTIDDIKAVPQIGFIPLIKNVTSIFTFDMWAWISIGFAFTSLLFFILYYYSSAVKTKRFYFGSIFVCIVLLGVALISGMVEKDSSINEQPAIIFATVAPVKNEPLDNAEDTFVLHEGTKVFILEHNKNWSKISLTDGSEGWIKASDIKAVK